MTYLWLSAVFLLVAVAVACLALLRSRAPRRLLRSWLPPALITAACLFVLTAIFDNLMIGIGLMAYSPEHLAGAAIGLAPLEDFSYPLAAIILIPSLWMLLSRRGSHDD
jgi:lycopene cyclase domain-containing protein